MSRFYTTPEGERFPLKEAPWDMIFKVYRSDRRKAKQGDPGCCLLALGVKRHRDVLDVYFGAGKDAYVVFKATEDEPASAVHFVLNTKAKQFIDAFDKDRKAQSVDLILKKPAKSWKLDYRRKSNARRREEVKNGAEVSKREGRKTSRMERLGLQYRPRAPISRSGNVNVAVD